VRSVANGSHSNVTAAGQENIAFPVHQTTNRENRKSESVWKPAPDPAPATTGHQGN
jgi:hypothetical protein